MRKLWPPTYDKVSSRIWSLAIAAAFTATVSSGMFWAQPPAILGILASPGTIVVIVLWIVTGIDPDAKENQVWIGSIAYSAIFFFYFLMARLFMRIFKPTTEIRTLSK